MRQTRWIIVAILAGVIMAGAWLLMSRRTKETIQPASAPVEHVAEADLCQLVPTGAVAVIHYAGGEQLKSAYERSALGQVLGDPEMQAFLRQPKEALLKRLSSHTDAPPAEVIGQMARWIKDKESVLAVYVGGKPAVAGCVRLGADALHGREVLAEMLKKSPSLSKRTFKGYEVTGNSDGIECAMAKDVFAAAGDAKTMDALLERIDSGASEPTTLSPPALDVGEKFVWAALDTPVLLQKARVSITNESAVTKFDAVVKELGAERIGRLEVAGGFDGAGIRTVIRLSGLTQGRGLFALYGGGAPIDDATVQMVPRDVAGASVAHINLAALWDTVMRIVEVTMDEADRKKFDTGLAQFERDANVRVKQEMIDQVGDLLVFYSKPGPMPMMGGEVALILALKDPQTFAQGMEHVLEYAGNQLAKSQQTPQRGAPVAIQRSKVGDVDVYYLAGMPMFSPAFAVKGQRAFLAITPMALNAAIAQAEHPRSSLLDNPDFQNVRAKLPGKPVAVSYSDTRQLMASVYAMIGSFGPMFAGRPNPPLDLALLPPLSSIQEKLFGDVTVVTADNGELVAREYSSLGLNLSSVAGGSMMAGMLLPALNTARDKARRTQCLSNLKQIGLGCFMYADKHNDKFPEKLDELIDGDKYLSSSKVFHCPSAPEERKMSYVYISGLTTKDDPDKILAYDADGNHRNAGRNVLFCDGHVEWMMEKKFQEILRRQR
jgi:prepilin-type processing-associated H-X9-DG protein